MILDALQCKNQGRPPVWLMRQAGRYMSEYRALRQKHEFFELCHTPELAAQITMQPIQAFGFDAAILFSDILVIIEALGGQISMVEKTGPVIHNPLTTEQEVDTIEVKGIEEKLDYVTKAIKLILKDLKVPLLGFAGAPFTVASYWIEGGSSRDFQKAKKWLFHHPESFHRLLQKITDATITYLKMQVKAGVSAVQIFDSWANALGPSQFRTATLPYLNQMIKALEGTPVILYSRGSSGYAEELAALKPAAISVDWNCDIGKLRNRIPKSIALQGNLDPQILLGPISLVEEECKKLLAAMKGDPGYIFNLGHGILPETPRASVEKLVEVIKDAK